MSISVYPTPAIGTPVEKDLFNQQVTTERTRIIALDPQRVISALRDTVVETTLGTVTHINNEYELAVTGTTDAASLQSAERTRYQVGFAQEWDFGIRIPVAATGNMESRWGNFGTGNGAGFGQNATGLFVFTRKATTDTDVAQADWNVDPMDGTGPSGITLDPSDGIMYHVDFTDGYSLAEFKVIVSPDNMLKPQLQYVVHRVRVAGDTTIFDPASFLRVEAGSNGTTGDYDVYVSTRTFTVLGRYNPVNRINADYRLGQTGASDPTIFPLISIQKKTGDYNTVPVSIQGYSVLVDVNCLLQLRLDGTLTASAFGTPQDTSAAETACESDIAATAISGGEILWEALVADLTGTGEGLGENFENLDLFLPAGSIISLCCRGLTGQPDPIESCLRWNEEW